MRFWPIRNPKDRTFLRYAGTNLLILGLSFLFGTIVFHIASGIVEKDIRQSDTSLLTQSRDTLDQELSVVQLSSEEICTDPRIVEFAHKSSSDPGFSYLDLTTAVNALSNYKLNIERKIVLDYFIYFKGSDYIVTPETCYTPDFYYHNEANTMSLSEDGWNQLLATEHHGETEAITMNFSTQKTDVLAYMESVPMRLNSTSEGTLVVLLRKSGIDNLFSGIDLSHGGWLYVLDDRGRLVTSISPDGRDIHVIDLKGHPAAGGSFGQRIQGTQMEVNYTVSPGSEWTYVLVQPESVAMKELHSFERVSLVLFALALLVGGASAFYMAYYNFKPVMNIAHSLQSAVGLAPAKDGGDAFHTINSSISALIVNNKTLEENVARLSGQAFVDRLLKGDLSSQAEADAGSQFVGFNIRRGLFLVVVLRVYGRNVIEGVSQEIINELNTSKVLLMDTFRRRFSGAALFQNIDLQSMAVVLCLENKPDVRDYVSRMLTGIFDEYLAQFNLKLLFGVSDFTSDPLDVWRSYQEAQETVEYVQLHREGKTKWYDELPIDSQGFYYPIDYEQRIINYVKAGDTGELERIFHIIIDENFEKRQLSATTIRALFYDIKGTAFKVSQQLPPDIGGLEPLARLEFDPSSEHNFDNLLNLLQKACRAMDENRHNKYRSLIQEVIRFIEKNYMKQDMGLGLAASEFHISEGYLSSLFKEQTGRNFTDYVEQVRMNAACELLKTTRITIAEICGKVGYNNVQSFRRAFKRIVGVSPMQMRNGTV